MDFMFARQPELPAYEGTPVKVPAAENYVPAVTIENLLRSVGYGDFITGTVVVSPRMRLPAQHIRVELLCAERLFRPKIGFPDEFERFYVSSKTTIPNTHSLEADSRYRFDFSLPVPAPLESKNQALDDTEILNPPSLGGGRTPDKTKVKYSVIWFVKVSLVNRLEYTLRDIEILANTALTFELDTNKVYKQSQELTEGLLKKSPIGVVTVEASPLTLDLSESLTAAASLFLTCVTTDSRDSQKILKNFSVEYAIHHVVRSRRLEGFCGKGISTESFENRALLAQKKVTPQVQWSMNSAMLTFGMDLAAVADLVPNYSTSLATSTYEAKLTLKHAQGTLVLEIPVVISRPPPPYA